MWDELGIDVGFFHVSPPVFFAVALAAVVIIASLVVQFISRLLPLTTDPEEQADQLQRFARNLQEVQTTQATGGSRASWFDRAAPAITTVAGTSARGLDLMPNSNGEGQTTGSPHGRERRASLRRHGAPVEVLIAATEPGQEPTKGIVLDRSRGGLSISMSQPAATGSVLRVRVASLADEMACVDVEVRHCRRTGKHWLVGCKFVEELPWTVLLLFG
jgi:hypothetical protein